MIYRDNASRLVNGAILLVLYVAVIAIASGCAGRTPDAKWAEKRQALTSLNNTFIAAAERKQLTDRQQVDIGEVLKMGTRYLKLAKQELPEGGTKFEQLLIQSQRVLDLIEAQLVTKETPQ